METNYQVIYSPRKTLALEITQELNVLVRAPLGIRKAEISAFVAAHQTWISLGLARMERRKERHPELSVFEETALRSKAKNAWVAPLLASIRVPSTDLTNALLRKWCSRRDSNPGRRLERPA